MKPFDKKCLSMSPRVHDQNESWTETEYLDIIIFEDKNSFAARRVADDGWKSKQILILSEVDGFTFGVHPVLNLSRIYKNWDNSPPQPVFRQKIFLSISGPPSTPFPFFVP
jgi:hypothetical protein